MKKIEVTICLGTTCFVMGASELESVMARIEVKYRKLIDFKGSPCLGYCRDKEYRNAPYAVVNNRVLSSVTCDSLYNQIMECLSSSLDEEE